MAYYVRMHDSFSSSHIPQKPSPVGPMVAVALIVCIFAAGGAYFFIHEKARMEAAAALSQ